MAEDEVKPTWPWSKPRPGYRKPTFRERVAYANEKSAERFRRGGGWAGLLVRVGIGSALTVVAIEFTEWLLK